jgi:hypothetical protein
MKSPQLQEMVRKIFSDEEMKSQFMADPESVFSAYSLTRAERQAVLITHARLGLMCSDSAQFEAAIKSVSIWI